MKRVLFALVAFVFTGAMIAIAEDPKPADPAQPQPKAVQPKIVQPVQPIQPRPVAVTAAKMAQLEEDFETLEAQREVRKAYVKAAEVGVQAAKINLDRVSKAGANVSQQELDQAKLGTEMAVAQLAIREAELKEIDVKVKFAKKRLEDAKAAGVRPLPGVRPVDPKGVDPLPPNVRFVDEKAVAELKAKIEALTAQSEKKAEEAKKADAELKVAKEELASILDAAKLGKIAAGTIEKLEAKVEVAKATAEKIAAERKALDASIADLRAKLKEIEK